LQQGYTLSEIWSETGVARDQPLHLQWGRSHNL
jgi:hypothetical protein